MLTVGLSVHLTESDYEGSEGSFLTVTVRKTGASNGSIIVRVTPMTAEQYESEIGPIPTVLIGDLAEGKFASCSDSTCRACV